MTVHAMEGDFKGRMQGNRLLLLTPVRRFR
jgi:hypothetical protein